MRYLLLALLFAVGYALYRSLTRPRADAPTARGEIAALGLESIEVARALPVAAIGGRSYRLVDGRCMRHRLPAFRPGAARWELLQRPGTETAPFPPGWQLVVRSGEVSPALRDALLRVVAGWDIHGTEGFLELEGDPEGVIAFVDDKLGETRLWQVHGFLKALAEA
jgi:hypothetical protein